MAKAKDILKKAVNESFLSGGNALDPVLGPSTGSNNPAYSYRVLTFNDDFQGNKQTFKGGYKYIHVGSYVETYDRKHNKLRGRVIKIVKDSDGYIIGAYVLNDKTGKVVSVDTDNIHVVEFPNVEKRLDYRVAQLLSPTKFMVSESVRKNGPISFKSNNEDCIATLNEGRVVVLRTFNNNVMEITEILDESEEVVDDILKAID